MRLGEYDDTATEDCNSKICIPRAEEHDVDMAFRHGKFSEIKNLNDIALLRLAKFVTFKGVIDWSRTKILSIVLQLTSRPFASFWVPPRGN